MTNAFDWEGKVGDSWAAEWARTDRSFAPLSRVLLDRISAAAGPTPRILDIGCGAGETSIDLAVRLADAEVRGIDLSSTLVETARARSDTVLFEAADASTWSGGDWRPDLLVSRHGVMFFDDPAGAFAHFRSVAAPGARLVFSCFRSAEENEWAAEIQKLLPAGEPADPHAPGPFAFADRDRVAAILDKAGWQGATGEPVDFRYVAGAGSDPVDDAMDFFSRIGPAARAVRGLSEADRNAFFERLRPVLCNHLDAGAVTFRAAAWIWTAHLSGRTEQ